MATNIDLALYAEHAAFWSVFGLTRLILHSRHRDGTGRPAQAAVSREKTIAPFSRTLLALHMLAFAVMYFGVGRAVLPRRVPVWFSGQRIVGSMVIASGAGLVAWALVGFRSWRFRAKLEEGHQLATEGPFRILRHPIYMGLNLLALGTALWVPTTIVWLAFVLMAIGSDLRARAEEALLERAFGLPYRQYRARTRRFVPYIY
jgi:protein-S-isoprenylcysteine O-methyltransferase Ste14